MVPLMIKTDRPDLRRHAKGHKDHLVRSRSRKRQSKTEDFSLSAIKKNSFLKSEVEGPNYILAPFPAEDSCCNKPLFYRVQSCAIIQCQKTEGSSPEFSSRKQKESCRSVSQSDKERKQLQQMVPLDETSRLLSFTQGILKEKSCVSTVKVVAEIKEIPRVLVGRLQKGSLTESLHPSDAKTVEKTPREPDEVLPCPSFSPAQPTRFLSSLSLRALKRKERLFHYRSCNDSKTGVRSPNDGEGYGDLNGGRTHKEIKTLQLKGKNTPTADTDIQRRRDTDVSIISKLDVGKGEIKIEGGHGNDCVVRTLETVAARNRNCIDEGAQSVFKVCAVDEEIKTEDSNFSSRCALTVIEVRHLAGIEACSHTVTNKNFPDISLRITNKFNTDLKRLVVQNCHTERSVKISKPPEADLKREWNIEKFLALRKDSTSVFPKIVKPFKAARLPGNERTLSEQGSLSGSFRSSGFSKGVGLRANMTFNTHLIPSSAEIVDRGDCESKTIDHEGFGSKITPPEACGLKMLNWQGCGSEIVGLEVAKVNSEEENRSSRKKNNGDANRNGSELLAMQRDVAVKELDSDWPSIVLRHSNSEFQNEKSKSETWSNSILHFPEAKLVNRIEETEKPISKSLSVSKNDLSVLSHELSNEVLVTSASIPSETFGDGQSHTAGNSLGPVLNREIKVNDDVPSTVLSDESASTEVIQRKCKEASSLQSCKPNENLIEIAFQRTPRASLSFPSCRKLIKPQSQIRSALSNATPTNLLTPRQRTYSPKTPNDQLHRSQVGKFSHTLMHSLSGRLAQLFLLYGLILGVLLPLQVEGRVEPCPFNRMCKCRYDFVSDDAPRARVPSPIEVICIGVPFAKFPKLPPGLMDQVDVVNAGLEVIRADDFDMTRVKNLRLMSNNIRTIGAKTLSEMGHHLFTLDLSYNALVDIPKEALRHLAALEWLNLQGNQIAELQRDDWNGLRDTLMSLFLAENNIDYVPQHSLTDFRKLLWLNLDDNNLNRLERDSLSRSINTLSLNHNLITAFPSDIVSEFKDLTWLYLRGNLIDRLPDTGFVFAKTIDKLDLGENFISFIPDHLFNNTLSVRDLHFDFNVIKEIQPYAFRGLNPSRLYLSANQITNITDRAFFGGPDETVVMLDLEKNDLGGVPKALSYLKNLRYLYLPGNEITEIQRHAFKESCSKLEALSLSGNFLSAVPRVALENCSMINHLNLGHNRIEQLDPEDFSTWGDNLETLVLRNNRLSSIPANAFKHTPRMRELSLSFNRIVDVNQDSFIDILGSLEILEISFGFYRDDFPETVFKPLTSLQWIALDNNNFRTIAETALYSFGELSYFNMDSNRLTKIPKTLFHQNVHKKLVDIRMANNFIEQLGVHTFHNLESLRTVVLTGNKITKVLFEAFKNLPMLNTIAISSNQINDIEFQAFSGLTNLVELELQQNRLNTFSLNNFANFSITQSPLSLNLSHNELTELHPGSVGQFAMKSLDISHNRLKQVPVNFLQIFMQFLEYLDISYNRITKLDTSAFGSLEQLQRLMIQHNNIEQIRPGAFNNLQNVQLVDLSHNHLQALPHMCFSDMLALRKVDFSYNHLRALPPSVFTGTSIEALNFAYNEFVSLPTSALAIVESTLHYLDISKNHLEHLDSTMFNSFSNLIELNIASNKLTILPDNVFVNLKNLISLDISENTVRANFKELFHYTQNVQKLNLAKIGFTASPTIPLPNLVSLNMSHNGISDIEVHSVVSLRQLRTLDLSYNQITHVRSRIWPYLPYLKRLDLSGNPIQSLTKDSFVGASRIETLILKDLNEIMRFDYDTLSHMGYLKELFLNTFPNIEKYKFRVGQLLATVHTLRTLHLEVREDALTDQLSGAFGPKLKELHISGTNLKAVDSKTFRGFQNKHELLLSITDTSIESLPDGLLTHLSEVAYLSLDLRRNKLKFLNSHVLYGNKSDWESRGTTFVAGGLALQGNEWTCDCALVWLGRWLRRWLRETLQIHTAVLKKAQQVDQLAREAVCYEPSTGQHVPLLDLRSEDLSCHASALSDTAHTSGTAANAPILPALMFLATAQAALAINGHIFRAGAHAPVMASVAVVSACLDAAVSSVAKVMGWGAAVVVIVVAGCSERLSVRSLKNESARGMNPNEVGKKKIEINESVVQQRNNCHRRMSFSKLMDMEKTENLKCIPSGEENSEILLIVDSRKLAPRTSGRLESISEFKTLTFQETEASFLRSENLASGLRCFFNLGKRKKH